MRRVSAQADPRGERCPLDECDGSGFVVDTEARTTRECRCRPQRIANAKAKRLSAVIPRKYQRVSFDQPPVTWMDESNVRAVRRVAQNIDSYLDEGRGIWFMGDVGTGKTTLAMLISKAALTAGRSVAIYSLPRLLSALRKTFEESSDLSYLQLLDSLSEVDLLHIDDVGAERSNEWVLEQLYSIVNSRYEEERSIVFTTNLDEAELEEQIGARTVSRLKEMCEPIKMFGSDERPPAGLKREWVPPRSVARYGEAPDPRLP
jgi:DNA replication protein DnaC